MVQIGADAVQPRALRDRVEDRLFVLQQEAERGLLRGRRGGLFGCGDADRELPLRQKR